MPFYSGPGPARCPIGSGKLLVRNGLAHSASVVIAPKDLERQSADHIPIVARRAYSKRFERNLS